MTRALLTCLALTACNGGGDSVTVDDPVTDDGETTETSETGDTDTETDTGTGVPSPTADTGVQGYGQPTLLEVTCNPTTNALRFLCDVTIEPAQPVELTFARTDGRSATRTVSGEDVASAHSLALYFMAPEQDYDVTVSAVAWPDDEVTTTITTTAAPSIAASFLAVTGKSTMGMIGSHLPCSTDAVAVVYDTETGDLLWYELFDPTGQFGLNDMLTFTEDGTVLGESRGDVIEVDLMGNDVVRLVGASSALGVTTGGAFGNFHHDIMKRNGTYYALYQEQFSGGFFPDVLDVLVLFDGTGAEVARWFPDEHLALPGNWGGDFLHTNTIFVDSAGDVHLSWLSQDSIGKLDGDWTSKTFGTPLWILEGRASGELQATITTDWSAIGGPDDFNEPHSLSLRADGRVQLLDNGNGRALVISVDEVTQTATVDGQYETRENSCGPQGTSQSTQAGNVVTGCAGSWVREYDQGSGSMIWEAQVQCPGGSGFGGPSASRWYPLDGW